MQLVADECTGAMTTSNAPGDEMVRVKFRFPHGTLVVPGRSVAQPGEHLVLSQLLQLGALLQPGKYQAISTLIPYRTLSTCREAELHASRHWRVVSEATYDGSNARSHVETCLIQNT